MKEPTEADKGRGQGKYLVRRKLVEFFINAFYTSLWNTAKPGHTQLQLETYPADLYHTEGAVVHVQGSDSCRLHGQAPMLSQASKMLKGNEVSMYIVNADAVYKR